MISAPILNSTEHKTGFTPSLRGKTSQLILRYANQQGKTALTHSYFSYPWYSFPPLYLDNTGCATTFLTNPSGGFVGGDDLSLTATLGKNTHVLLTTPSATKIYRMLEQSATQSIDITVGPNAILEWMPDLTIPFAGSRFSQSINIRMSTGATVILWDAMAAGRVARGERWVFSQFANQINILGSNGSQLHERYSLLPEIGTSCLTFEQWNYSGSLLLFNDQMSTTTWENLYAELTSLFQEETHQVLAGVTETPLPGLAIKLLARSTPEMIMLFEKTWCIARKHLLKLDLPALRRY